MIYETEYARTSPIKIYKTINLLLYHEIKNSVFDIRIKFILK